MNCVYNYILIGSGLRIWVSALRLSKKGYPTLSSAAIAKHVISKIPFHKNS